MVGTINVLGTVVAASLMDKFGRKQLLSTSFSGMGVAMLSMAAGETRAHNESISIETEHLKMTFGFTSGRLVTHFFCSQVGHDVC